MFRKLTLNSGIKQQFIPLLCQYGHTGLDRTRVKIYLLQLHVPQKFLLTRYSIFFTTIVVFKISMRMLFEYFSFQSSPYNIGHNWYTIWFTFIWPITVQPVELFFIVSTYVFKWSDTIDTTQMNGSPDLLNSRLVGNSTCYTITCLAIQVYGLAIIFATEA